jgi:xanthosine utilization system XapX-like protein
MQIQFDVEISNTITFIGLTVSNNIVSQWPVKLVVCSRLVSRVLVGLLVGVIYWLVGVCSEARRILSILWGMKTYRVASCLYVMMGSVRRVSSGHVLTRGRCDLQLAWVLVSRIPWCAGDAGILRIAYCR